MTRRQRANACAEQVVRRHSPMFCAFFSRLFAYDLRRSFHAVRLLGALPGLDDKPLIVFANHPSWWDAAIFVWSSRALFGGRRCFSPIEAAMLTRYPFFGRVGGFPVNTHDLSSAAAFLATGERVLASGGMLLVNGEGVFKDVRQRPLAVAAGIAHLAKRAPDAVLVPLAIDYVFWDERRPNALLHFGDAVLASALPPELGTAQAYLGSMLETAMDDLREAVMTRDQRRFRTLIAGRVGINGFYDAWRRGRAYLRGQSFSPAHSDAEVSQRQ